MHIPSVEHWDWAAIATFALAIITYWLARETKRLAKDWRDTSKDQITAWEKASKEQIAAWGKSTKDQIGIQVWMAMEARFDSEEMRKHRRRLAFQLDPYKPDAHKDIREPVLEFFESLGAVYRLGFLDEALAVSSFSYHASRWWEAAKPYIDHERREHGGDTTLYADFSSFADAMRKHEPEPIDKIELQAFLEGERGQVDS